MLYTVIKKNTYQDSINLMLITKQLSAMEGVVQVSVMMGTPANMDILKNSGLYTPDLEEAGPSDICIVVNTDAADIVSGVVQAVEDFIVNQSTASSGSYTAVARSWDSAMRRMPDANWALISIAGEYAAREADIALEKGLNVMIFSDNITVEDEKSLKEKARDKGLLVMGPDCGTAIISGVPLAFANALEKGNIGIIGASGTGIQEVTTLISRRGGGCSQVIGLGGRDLSSPIGGIMALEAIDRMAADPETHIIVFISKPPAPDVRKRVVEKLNRQSKPVVAIFLGEDLPDEDNVAFTWTLDSAAGKAVELSRLPWSDIACIRQKTGQRGLQGLYSGGTLASEAGMMLARAMDTALSTEHPAGVMFQQGPHRVIDLGDDAYTQGRPHPMIDPTLRLELLHKTAMDASTAVILLDFVIGYGGCNDVAAAFAPAIAEIHRQLESEGRRVVLVGSVTGTDQDPTPYNEQRAVLEQAGVCILDSNTKAVAFALEIIRQINREPQATIQNSGAENLWDTPCVVNQGIPYFKDAIQQHGGRALQFQWTPPAGGNPELTSILDALYSK